jgi:hypothetical protein
VSRGESFPLARPNPERCPPPRGERGLGGTVPNTAPLPKLCRGCEVRIPAASAMESEWCRSAFTGWRACMTAVPATLVVVAQLFPRPCARSSVPPRGRALSTPRARGRERGLSANRPGGGEVPSRSLQARPHSDPGRGRSAKTATVRTTPNHSEPLPEPRSRICGPNARDKSERLNARLSKCTNGSGGSLRFVILRSDQKCRLLSLSSGVLKIKLRAIPQRRSRQAASTPARLFARVCPASDEGRSGSGSARRTLLRTSAFPTASPIDSRRAHCEATRCSTPRVGSHHPSSGVSLEPGRAGVTTPRR